MSRILAALENPGSPPAPATSESPMHPFFTPREKRKHGQEGSGTPGPSNKRRALLPHKDELNRLPSGLLGSTQSPDTGVDTPESPSPHSTPATQQLRGLYSTAIPALPGVNLHLRYDVDVPVSSLDVGGHDQIERMADFVSKSIDNLSTGMKVRDGLEYLGLKDPKDILPGLEVRLIPHQIIGVSWMLHQEKETVYKGGIMADDMGLGKTVQMIATMAMNMPDMNDKTRTTLIVVPAALLHQWKEEIEAKTNGIFSVHVHHGKNKLKTLSALQSQDVIITTYQTLNLDFTIKDPDIEPDEAVEYLIEHGGLLAKMKYYRVVLDEAQYIRNRGTRSSKTVAMLRTKYRWMLTGTPVTNTLADLYGLIRFGHFRPWNDWNDFDTYIAKVQIEDPPLAGLRAQEILKPILIRRTKNSTLEGKPLLELPPKTIDIITSQFSSDEREIYDNFEQRAKIRVNKFIREQTILKNHAAVLVMILRLRQLCCHPHLILSQTDEYDDPTLLVGSDLDKELGRAKRTLGLAWVEKAKKRALTRARAIQLDFTEGDDSDTTCPVCRDMYENNGRLLSCGHEVCADCVQDLSQSPVVHDGVFGYGDEKENSQVEKNFEQAEAKGYRPCPTCKKMCDLSPNAVYISAAFEPTDDELQQFSRLERDKKRVKRAASPPGIKLSSPVKSTFLDPDELADISSDDEDVDFSELIAASCKKKVQKPKIDDDDEMDITMGDITRPLAGGSDDEDEETPRSQGKNRGKATVGQSNAQMVAAWRLGDDNMEPSAKMLELIKLLKEADIAGDKTIVYSQWTSMLDLIETLFGRYGIQNLRYDGKMSREARDKTVLMFRKSGGPKVILISTKCGGVGLNLVAANRVVNMDLSWNYAAESQAYDRVHRLGQEKDVFVKRLVIENTIEERMLKLQELKVGLADAALGEGSGMKLHKMSVKEIKTLFGMTPPQK
ncbi:hypothetical protein BV25DRAFT_1826795 [Artomyces pyxidatus]|uniref:Uncharacterized protein n=1 Tax=Artomyces pyxidatus TaxID=48021 RepID=A0ACB8SYS2_9AGAM|nr:hypothetical protein BV25DRAFT_1826795 [Artomyces pyxidatus]